MLCAALAIQWHLRCAAVVPCIARRHRALCSTRSTISSRHRDRQPQPESLVASRAHMSHMLPPTQPSARSHPSYRRMIRLRPSRLPAALGSPDPSAAEAITWPSSSLIKAITYACPDHHLVQRSVQIRQCCMRQALPVISMVKPMAHHWQHEAQRQQLHTSDCQVNQILPSMGHAGSGQ